MNSKEMVGMGSAIRRKGKWKFWQPEEKNWHWQCKRGEFKALKSYENMIRKEVIDFSLQSTFSCLSWV